MSILAEFMILSGGDNRQPMLEKHLYDSWKSRMELYMQNREHGRMILESVEHGPFIWLTIEENGVTRTKKHEELCVTKKIQADYDLKATNIILQGLPSDVYSLVNHHRVSKDLWERVQLLMLVNQQTHLAEFPQIDFGLAVPVFKQGDDPIDAIKKMMSFLSNVVTSCFPTTNNQLRNSFNPRQQATIHDERVTFQPVQGRQSSFAAGSSKVLNDEELEFLVDPRVAEAKAVLMANLFSYRSDVLSEIPHYENTHMKTLIMIYQEMQYSEQTHLYLLKTKNAVVRDTNSFAQQDAMILSVFEQLSNQVTNCNKVNKDNLIANESLFAKLERYKERVKSLEERQNVDLSTRERIIMDDIIQEKNAQFADFEKEINYLKQTLYEELKEKELLTKTFNVFKNESKEKEAKNIDKEIALEKKVKELDNILPMLYDGSVIAKETNMISIADSEETLLFEEESRSKMLLKQKLSDEQAFRLQTSHPNIDQSASLPVKIEAPRELPKVILVNTSLKKIKYHLGQFDNVVKKRITLDALTEDEWGFEHTKAVFLKEINPFLKTLKDIFNVFDKDLLNEFLIENDRLLDQIISPDIVNIVAKSSMDINTSVNVNSSTAMNDSVNYVEMCNKCLKLEAELIKQHNMVEKDEYNRLSKSFSKLEQHCISLELAMQLNKEIFQKNNTSVNQTEPSFDQLFEFYNLKAGLQAKYTTIEKLKENIKRLKKLPLQTV
ncbi:hypothetical protein Tco_1438550 [Tanacetum coccineum]